jgi:ABC-type Fe3+-hydroxamate transport system substrate-binding protein
MKPLHPYTLRALAVTLLLLIFTLTRPQTPAQPAEPNGESQSGGEGTGGRRVVSLAPSLTEWAFALGAGERLAGRSDACDTPPEARLLPSAGGLFPADAEQILRLRPTDLLMIDGHAPLKAQLTRLGVRVHTLQPRALKDLAEVARGVGALLGARAAAEAEAWSARVGALEARLRASPPPHERRIFIEVWPRPLSAAGAESYMGDLARAAGAEVVPRGLGEWPQVSLEQLIAWDPEVILVSSPARAAELTAPSAPAPWRALRAVREGRVWAREGRLERPSPRALEDVEWLAALLRAP